jgi:hypothetical protein
MLRSTTATNAVHTEKVTAYAQRHPKIILTLPSEAEPKKLRSHLRRKTVG